MEAFIVLADSLHLAKELSLLFGEIGGELDLIGDDEVAEGAVTTIVYMEEITCHGLLEKTSKKEIFLPLVRKRLMTCFVP